MTKKITKESLVSFGLLTLSSLLIVLGTWLFKYPNNFTFGGITGLSIVLSKALGVSASSLNLIMNIILIVIGIIVLGRDFAGKTIYVCVLSTVGISIMDKLFPILEPLTNEPMLEFIFAVGVPGVASAILFNMDASSGGTDIAAMIVQKYSTLEIGSAIFVVDLIIAVSAFFVFDFQTGLFSITGLLAKTLVIDSAIENFNLCKYFTIVTTNPEPICEYIQQSLHRSATIYKAEGAYSHKEKSVILAVMKRSQAVRLRRHVKTVDPSAFIMITNSSEIIGKGFRGFN